MKLFSFCLSSLLGLHEDGSASLTAMSPGLGMLTAVCTRTCQHLGYLGYGCTASQCPPWCIDCPFPAVQAKSLGTLLMTFLSYGTSTRFFPESEATHGSHGWVQSQPSSLLSPLWPSHWAPALPPCQPHPQSSWGLGKEIRTSLPTQNPPEETKVPVTSVHSRVNQGPCDKDP